MNEAASPAATLSLAVLLVHACFGQHPCKHSLLCSPLGFHMFVAFLTFSGGALQKVASPQALQKGFVLARLCEKVEVSLHG